MSTLANVLRFRSVREPISGLWEIGGIQARPNLVRGRNGAYPPAWPKQALTLSAQLATAGLDIVAVPDVRRLRAYRGISSATRFRMR